MDRLERMYAEVWDAHGDACADLDRSLNPRSGEALYAAAAALGVAADWLVLDAGCGRGTHSLELARRFGCHVVGIDAVRGPLTSAPAGIFAQALLEAIPAGDATFDLVWCRDMLVHVPDLDRAMAECARVLKPGGRMLVWATIATDLMEPGDATRLYEPLAIVGANTSLARLRWAFRSAGLRIVQEENLSSELIEFYEERDGRAARELMRIARMRRRRAELEAQWGAAKYETTLALYGWIVYHLLGKLETILFVAGK
jgi:2-polyprenyl-3-methyl-5-hydroxy-6-metoxy-1,4-benzoquinol methylase